MFCKHCGEEIVTDDRSGVIHNNGKYACYPEVKMSDPRWPIVAEISADASEYDEPEILAEL